MAQTVIGFFDNASEAQQAVQALVDKGFSRSNIDVSTSASGATGTSNLSSGGSLNSGVDTTADINRNLDSVSGSNYSSDSTIDSTSGNTFDRTYNKDYDTNRDEESGISKFFRNLFGDDDDEVKTYSGVANRSGSIVTVHAQSSDEAERAADILDDYGAVDVNERASQYGLRSNTGSDTGSSSGNYASGTDITSNESTSSIPIIEENLNVGKRQVQTGGARLRSRIVERPVEESLRLREEHVRVERTSVDRPATDADFQNFQEGTIEIVESAEVPVVSKEARVVEEISLNKDVDEREETIRDTVRSTQVDIENLDKDDLNTNRNRSSSQDDFTTNR
jgi:uncharacterized protein (TIGR02271 family)